MSSSICSKMREKQERAYQLIKDNNNKQIVQRNQKESDGKFYQKTYTFMSNNSLHQMHEMAH